MVGEGMIQGYVDLITFATALATMMLARRTSPGPWDLDSRADNGESNKESCFSSELIHASLIFLSA